MDVLCLFVLCEGPLQLILFNIIYTYAILCFNHEDLHKGLRKLELKEIVIGEEYERLMKESYSCSSNSQSKHNETSKLFLQ